MERTEDIGDLIRALSESFQSHPRPCRMETDLGRAWIEATRAIERVAYRSLRELADPSCAELLCAIVRACRKLGAVEAAAYAAALGGALKLDLSPVFADVDCDCAA
jgi:hypothetical protein